MGSDKSDIMGDIVQQVFNKISLERNPSIWHSEVDTKKASEKRIKFLAEFDETLFHQALLLEKSPARKNDALAKALQLKSEKADDSSDALKFLSQALCFSSDDNRDQLVRKRSNKWEDLKEIENSLKDLLLLSNKDDDDKSKILDLSKRLDLHPKEEKDLENTLETIEKTINDVTNKPKVHSFLRHKTLKEFGNQIDIKNEKGRGRFLVAAQDIEPGEMLAADTSYAALLDRAHVPTNCDNCLLPAPHQSHAHLAQWQSSALNLASRR